MESELTILVLEYFSPYARLSRKIHDAPQFEPYERRQVHERMYSLHRLGFLRKAYGEKSGSVYIISKAGQKYLEQLKNAEPELN